MVLIGIRRRGVIWAKNIDKNMYLSVYIGGLKQLLSAGAVNSRIGKLFSRGMGTKAKATDRTGT